ncbi:hypothetical protein GCM10007049_00280 [Echinicola pacifica]|uniref:Uncharacterized protein n=1 Tax=Echinicola pacifica TaxID=346377 RepID=A0A918PIY6_9BACT|nr:DUF6428 family protein [Echinicola pacifica]GGZ12534.1 hypothetical protein GCM10007049_00280 [Echinicola pacifica]
MKTKEFIDLLNSQSAKVLTFEYASGMEVRADFHITEIKNVDFNTVDCGGLANQWSETHVQLWENDTLEPEHQVNTDKALKIFEAVEKVRPTYKDTELYFEYSNPQFGLTILPVDQVQISDNRVLVVLGQSNTTCKAKDRASTDEEKAAACCGTPAAPAVAKVNVRPKNQSCAPNSGCC